MRTRLMPRMAVHGFTLLEIMIAIFIFAIIVTTILASYRTVFFRSDEIGAGFELYNMVGGCLNRMALDIDGIAVGLPPKYTQPEVDADPDPYRIEGDSSDLSTGSFSRLRFASRSHAGLGGAGLDGIAEIIYYVDEDANGNAVLRRSDRLYPYEFSEQESLDPVVCEHLKSLVFTYIDSDGESLEAWDSESEDQGYASPRAIQVKLEIGRSESESLVFDTLLMLPVIRETME